MSRGLEEVETEKQISKQGDKTDLFDRFVLVVAAIEPLSTLPQVYQVWFKHQTVGVSALTWLLYALSESIWLAYGLKKRDRPLIAASLLWMLMELLVGLGALLH